jgi:hypothetical protein
VICVKSARAETVFVSATVEVKVPVATPLASVGLAGCVRVFPLPVAESPTVTPLTGFPLASFTVTVTVAVPLPAVIELGAALTVERDGSTREAAPRHAMDPVSLSVLPGTGTNLHA